ncbi:MAG: hypothetical protein PHX68_00825 [Alphaproteobacteria bacterium]|nr:hypothetical protein [Alphaproteobacteria bacterium]
MTEDIAVIDRKGATHVARKKSWVAFVKTLFAIFTIGWLALAGYGPVHLKHRYGDDIKKSVVVGLFSDLQSNIAAQYRNLLDTLRREIDLDKPIGYALDKVKLADKPAAQLDKATAGAKQLTGIAAQFGATNAAVDKALSQTENISKAVNARLDQAKSELARAAQAEIDKALDAQIQKALRAQTGGAGNVLLTDYGAEHVSPWRPSTWSAAVRLYDDLARSSADVVRALTGTADRYFDRIAWGMIGAVWLAGFVVWFFVRRKMKALIAPFIVCPRCGHAFADKRSGVMLLNLLKPWKWLGL